MVSEESKQNQDKPAAAAPGGVMDSEYSSDRLTKPHLVFRYKTRARVVADAVKRFSSSSGPYKLLDLGSAEGLTLMELSNTIPLSAALGIEYSAEMFSLSPAFPAHIKLIQGDICKLPEAIPENSFDVVSALAVLEHLESPERAAAQALRVLRPGGLFVATCPRPGWDKISASLGFHKDDTHETNMNKETFLKVFEEVGFEILSYETFMFVPVAFLPYLRIKVSPGFALIIDKILSKLRVFEPLFINQCLVGKKSGN